jgi:hypothetical protein
MREIFRTLCRRYSPTALMARGRVSATTTSTQVFFPVVARAATEMGRTGRSSSYQPRLRRSSASSRTDPCNFKWYVMGTVCRRRDITSAKAPSVVRRITPSEGKSSGPTTVRPAS